MFIDNKYTKWYFNIINSAKVQQRIKKDKVYYESHHIIPKCMGGIEEVLLTGKEHFICHLLLCRMTTGNEKHKMINAIIKMCFSKSKGQHRYTSKSYSLVKKFIAEKNSEMFKGKPKSEKIKNKMKGRSGTWKRTKRHRQEMSKRQKNKSPKWILLSDDDPIKIKIKNKISLKMINNNPMKDDKSKQRMINTLKNKKWFTNGIDDVFCEYCPDGYINGRTKNRKVKTNACEKK